MGHGSGKKNDMEAELEEEIETMMECEESDFPTPCEVDKKKKKKKDKKQRIDDDDGDREAKKKQQKKRKGERKEKELRVEDDDDVKEEDEEEGDDDDCGAEKKKKKKNKKPKKERPPARPHRRTPNHKVWSMITILKKRIDKHTVHNLALKKNIKKLEDKLDKNEANLEKWTVSLGKYKYENDYRKENGFTQPDDIGFIPTAAETQEEGVVEEGAE